ncbi:hypothetical protein M7775_02115 [Sporomusa sphaeroides DSM 2875]|uniref:hypothetical protein n=1 Tax=Sporomusa sphaeroides TaxID=47679 RepID=UPI00202F9569|nr:hypothetical protein [Sporomusa sphaeroides]MCM0757363.1 hypothetical protein [Sporomusa sphaeroides DSM 2875]
MRKKLFGILLGCLLSVSWVGSCSAAAIYTMTEAELTRLEEIFSLLKVSNHALQTDLEQSKTDLQTAKNRLTESAIQLEMLEAQLIRLREESNKAKAESLEAQTLLQKANQSLEAYEREAKGRIKSLTWQRNFWGVLAIAAAAKK